MMANWTFLTNHAIVLGFLAMHPRVTAREMSLAVGITERATRKIIADLVAAGYIGKKREGRRIRYRINPGLPLRHEMHKDTAVGTFLNVLGWREPVKRRRHDPPGEDQKSARESKPSTMVHHKT